MPRTLPACRDIRSANSCGVRRSAYPVAVTDADQPWQAPAATGRLSAVVPLPGSKSQTNRALVLAALSESPTRIGAPLIARDTLLMAGALTALGAPVTLDGADFVVQPG